MPSFGIRVQVIIRINRLWISYMVEKNAAVRLLLHSFDCFVRDATNHRAFSVMDDG